MTKKRPIDLQREAALSIEVGTPEDNSEIEEMISGDKVMYIVTAKSIYTVNLADDIDPARTNPKIPRAIQQRVLTYGASDELVGRIFLTAKRLFDSPYLADSIDKKKALSLSFDALKELASIREAITAFETDEAKAIDDFERRNRQGASFVIPAVVDVYPRCKGLIQRADHSIQALFDICKLFYGEVVGKKWFESLHEFMLEEYGDDDRFVSFLNEALPFLQFVRNMRNCVEHPKPTEQIIARDFSIDATGKIIRPTIEVIHPKTAQPAVGIPRLMVHLVDQISGIFELFAAFLCSKHIKPHGRFRFEVIDLPEQNRRNKFVRFGYGFESGNQIIIAS